MVVVANVSAYRFAWFTSPNPSHKNLFTHQGFPFSFDIGLNLYSPVALTFIGKARAHFKSEINVWDRSNDWLLYLEIIYIILYINVILYYYIIYSIHPFHLGGVYFKITTGWPKTTDITSPVF